MDTQVILDVMAQMIRVGFVVDRNPGTMRVRVELRDTVTSPLVSGWLPVGCPRAHADKHYDLPDIGDQVLCLFTSMGFEDGWCVCSMYGKEAPPVASGDIWHRTFSDGTYLEYDRAVHKLTAYVKGDVKADVSGNIDVELGGNGNVTAHGPLDLTSAAKIALNTPALSMGGAGGQGGTEAQTQGNIHHRGTIRVNDGDVVINGISFLGHVHTCPHGGETGVPQ